MSRYHAAILDLANFILFLVLLNYPANRLTRLKFVAKRLSIAVNFWQPCIFLYQSFFFLQKLYAATDASVALDIFVKMTSLYLSKQSTLPTFHATLLQVLQVTLWGAMTSLCQHFVDVKFKERRKGKEDEKKMKKNYVNNDTKYKSYQKPK